MTYNILVQVTLDIYVYKANQIMLLVLYKLVTSILIKYLENIMSGKWREEYSQ